MFRKKDLVKIPDPSVWGEVKHGRGGGRGGSGSYNYCVS